MVASNRIPTIGTRLSKVWKLHFHLMVYDGPFLFAYGDFQLLVAI